MSTLKTTWKSLALIVGVFLACFFMPVHSERFRSGVIEALALVRWYAREHVLLCLIPAFFIAGAISVFVRQASVMRYLGPKANKALAYGVASVSGTILAVCSCTVLPLFAGIYRMGAGLGPACAFLYSGPAINVLAIILTARILGLELGVARAVGAILFSILIGLAMHLIYRKEEIAKIDAAMTLPEEEDHRPLWKTSLFFAAMVGVLVFANWAKPADDGGVWTTIYRAKWIITGLFAIALAGMIPTWFRRSELGEWIGSTWGFTKQILPLLLAGVLAAGFLLGRPGNEGVIPSRYVEILVGANPDAFLEATGLTGGVSEGFWRATWSLWSNLFAAVAGALMYFATLTEVPILQGLLGAGMGKGPALALLLAGPALSLPNMLVIAGVLGVRKAITFVLLVVVMATISGMIFGTWF
ncbi:MAG: permease [Phycisphaerae bacterium]|nr:permease [Phycisphaerae bacterium]